MFWIGYGSVVAAFGDVDEAVGGAEPNRLLGFGLTKFGSRSVFCVGGLPSCNWNGAAGYLKLLSSAAAVVVEAVFIV